MITPFKPKHVLPAFAGGGEFSAYAYAVRNSTSTLHIGGGSYSRIDVDFSATFDPGALARAEWIKYLAAFFNLEPHANRVFAGIKAKFDQTKGLTAAAAAVVAPKVLWISGNGCSVNGCAATISTASYQMDYVKAAGGVTPAAADLAKHCPKNLATTFGPYDSAVSAADIALGYVNAFVCTDAGLKALLAAGIDVVIDESSADSFVTNNFGDNFYRLSNFMHNFGFSSAQTAERLRQQREADVARLRTALREAEAAGVADSEASVLLAEEEAEAVERAAKARARRDERIMGQTAERPLKDYPFLNKVLRADRLMGQSNAQGYATFGTAWFEDAIPRADITLDDLAFYLHPTLMPRARTSRASSATSPPVRWSRSPRQRRATTRTRTRRAPRRKKKNDRNADWTISTCEPGPWPCSAWPRAPRSRRACSCAWQHDPWCAWWSSCFGASDCGAWPSPSTSTWRRMSTFF